jgi:hypothetical protein
MRPGSTSNETRATVVPKLYLSLIVMFVALANQVRVLIFDLLEEHYDFA